MPGFLRSILIAILAVTGIVLFFNLAFFFPWYLTLVEKGFEVSQMIASDNYLRKEYHDTILDDMDDLPVFCDHPITIEANHIDEDRTAIAAVNGEPETFYGMPDKPYVQMGNLVEVKITADYPFRMKLFGEPLTLAPINISFNMTTTTTKHYKDLDYEYVIDSDDSDIYANYFEWEDDIE